MSGLKSEQESLRLLLVDTVKLLCRNGLRFVKQLQVQGLLAVTIDEADVFVVQIGEVMKSEASDISIPAEVTSSEENGNLTETTFDGSQNQETNTILSKSKSLLDQHTPGRKQSSTKSSKTSSTTEKNSQSCRQTIVKEEQDDVTLIESDCEDKGNKELPWSQNWSDCKTENQSELREENTFDTYSLNKKPAIGSGDRNISTLPILKRQRAARVKSEVAQMSSVSYNVSGLSQHQDDYESGTTNFMASQDYQEFEEGEEEFGSMNWNSTMEEYNNEDQYFPDQDLDEDGSDFPDGAGSVEISESFNGQRRSRKTICVCEYEDCRKVFNHRRNLYRHQRTKHGAIYGARGQVCFFCSVPTCRRVFYVQRTLDKHMREVHSIFE